MAVTMFALTPIRINPRQIGVINLVTGARNDSCNIFPIVGLVVVSPQIYPLIKPELKVCVVGKSSGEVIDYFKLNPAALDEADGAIFIVSAIASLITVLQRLPYLWPCDIPETCETTSQALSVQPLSSMEFQ